MLDKVLEDISHRRYNPLRGSWILVSPHRTKRPWQGQQEGPAVVDLPEHDPECYLCPGNSRAAGELNPNYSHNFVFVNDYSAVREQQAEYEEQPSSNGTLDSHAPLDGRAPWLTLTDLSSLLLRAESVQGKCYVLTFSPKHHLTLPDMPSADIVPIVETWTRIYAAHVAPTNPLAQVASTMDLVGIEAPPASVVSTPTSQLRYMQIFENKGAAMGCSNPHPHCQVWTTSTLPEEPAAEGVQMRRYRREHDGRHLLADYVQLEMEKKERIVWQNDSFLILCPWWAIWPFEAMIIAKRHIRALVDFTATDRLHFAEAIQDLTTRYDNLFQTTFPYSSGIHQAPLAGADEEIESSYFHMHFYPPLLRSASVKKFLVGYELLAEPQRDITPEQAAKRLRDCGGDLYRRSS